MGKFVTDTGKHGEFTHNCDTHNIILNKEAEVSKVNKNDFSLNHKL